MIFRQRVTLIGAGYRKYLWCHLQLFFVILSQLIYLDWFLISILVLYYCLCCYFELRIIAFTFDK